MPPNTPQPTDPSQQPATTPQPSFTPPTNVSQPSAGAQDVSGMNPPTKENLEKQKKIAYGLAIVSILLFVVGILFGYSLAFAAIAGAYALFIGIKTKTTPLIVLGAIGTVINLALFTLATFSNL